MRVVCLSDTHMRHEQVIVPPCNLLVHAGDITQRGTFAELDTFVAWFSRQRAGTKIFIAGNEDECCERDPERVAGIANAAGVTYLDEQSTVVGGLTVFGSPITPSFCDMAFNRDRGPAIRPHWAKIPARVDILVTHGPPYGIADRTSRGHRVGCVDLLERVQEVQPRLHVFGHIHESHGQTEVAGLPTRFVNAACVRQLAAGEDAATVVELEL